MVLEKTLESPLDGKEIKPVNSKGNQPWIFIGRTDAEAPILWPPDVKSWLIRNSPDAGKDWRKEEQGMTQDEMVRWHHWLNGHEFEQRRWWRTGKPSVLQYIGSSGVGNNWATEQQQNKTIPFCLCVNIFTSATKCTFYKKWQPTPVFLPGESPWSDEPGKLSSMGWHKSQTQLSN